MSHKKLTLEQVPTLCKELIQQLGPKTAVLLDGTLGAGKTHLVKELLRALGGEEALSPTFSLINSYKSSQAFSIYHVDLYRLQDEEDLESSGFWDLFVEDNSVILIEWASKIKREDFPLDWRVLMIEIRKVPGQDSFREYQVT